MVAAAILDERKNYDGSGKGEDKKWKKRYWCFEWLRPSELLYLDGVRTMTI